jgi:hypothetical protein
MADDKKEPEWMSYKDKIQSLLKRVENGEEIYKKEEENPLHQKIKAEGVKPVLVQIFTEGMIGDYTITEEETEESLRIPDTNLFRVKLSSGVEDQASDYWAGILTTLKSKWKVYDNIDGLATVQFGTTGSPHENLALTLVRDEDRHDKLAILFQWTDAEKTTSDEIKDILSKVGMIPEDGSIKDLDDKVVMAPIK